MKWQEMDDSIISMNGTLEESGCHQNEEIVGELSVFAVVYSILLTFFISFIVGFIVEMGRLCAMSRNGGFKMIFEMLVKW